MEQKSASEYRMSRERDDALDEVLTRQFKSLVTELDEVEKVLTRLKSAGTVIAAESPEVQADTALKLLDDVQRITGTPRRGPKLTRCCSVWDCGSACYSRVRSRGRNGKFVC
jgi:hypothetical protein